MNSALQDTQRFTIGVRCRPLSSFESQSGNQSILDISDTKADIILKNPKLNALDNSKTLKFNHIYGPDATQEQIYKELASPIIRSVIDGQDATILAYGKTGVGKTYTMLGKQESPELRGIIPRACEEIFKYLEGISSEKVSVTVSHFEVHSEEVKDLLSGDNPKKCLELKEQADGGVYIKGLSSFEVKSVDEIERINKKAQKNRSAPTNCMNVESYCGHAFFTIKVQTSYTGSDQKVHEKKGKLTLVDLAGSERFLGSFSTAETLRKQIIKTNHSMATFDQVISALANPKSAFVPYRNSKLTRLLQNSLNGSVKTVIIANVSPSGSSYGESLATLKVAHDAQIVKNKTVPQISKEKK